MTEQQPGVGEATSPPRPSKLRRRLARIARALLPPLLVLAALVGAWAYFTRPALPRIGLPSFAPPTPTRPAVVAPLAGTIRLPLLPVQTLDPGRAYDSTSIEVVQLLFEGLLVADAQGTLGPGGAESFEVSPDGKSYTFLLDPRARWSDGKPVVAGDYVFAWRRNVAPQTDSPYANALFPIRNAARIHQGALPPDQLGVRAPDDRTLVVELEEAAPHFPYLVATWTYYPLRADVLAAHGDAWATPDRLIGNGPFKIESASAEQGLVLGRNPAARVAPGLERIVFRPFPSLEAAFEAYRAGELDLMLLPDTLLERVNADPALKPQVQTFSISSTTFLVLNVRRPHLRDPRVRQALALSLDRKQLVAQALGFPAEPARSVHPSDIAGRDPAAWPPDDAERAKRLLADAGYPQGRNLPEIVLTVGPGGEELFRYIGNRWAQTLGLRVRGQTAAAMEQFRRSSAWVEQGDAYLASWQSDYPDPYNWFNLLWDSSNDPLQFNSGWRNAAFDRLVRAAGRETDPGRRAAAYAQAEAIIGREVPVIPLYHGSTRYLVKPYVYGFAPGRTALTVPLLRTRVR